MWKNGFRAMILHMNNRGRILGYAGLSVIAINTIGKCAWEYRVNGENPPQAISDTETILTNGPIEWKISRTIRLRDPQGKIEAEARGLECKINNVATTSIVVNCNNANEQQEMKTKYEGKTYKFMLGCVSTGQ